MKKTSPDFIDDLNALIAREAGRYKLDVLRETDWTVARVMQEHGLTEDQSRKVLDKLVADGTVKKVRIHNPNGGGHRLAYRPVEPA